MINITAADRRATNEIYEFYQDNNKSLLKTPVDKIIARAMVKERQAAQTLYRHLKIHPPCQSCYMHEQLNDDDDACKYTGKCTALNNHYDALSAYEKVTKEG